jgi:GTPase SAR1 family protein
MPLNTTLRGPLAKNSDRGTSLPFVFLVGNHSSGKSSFINYVLGRSVQTAGVAPTDDCFTVIAPGPKDVDQDGPALVGDPDIGFEGLRQFGPTLIHHAQLKVREGIQNQNFMMVDSPGMIDSPVSSGGMSMGFGIGRSLTDASNSGSTSQAVMDRGYDFQGVVRWFAERADVVLLFFDPDKPGTTGETLSILLHSLGGMDHKLLIVLNKADQFKKVSLSAMVIFNS